MLISLPSVIAGSAALLGLLIASALFSTRGQRSYPNRVLATGVLISTTYLLSLVSRHSPNLHALTVLQLGGISVFLFGPGLYCYVRALCEPQFRAGWRQLVHALPYTLVLVDNAGLLAPGGAGTGQQLVNHPLLLGVFYYLLMLGYLLAAARLLYRYHRRLNNIHSSLDGVSLHWLATLLAVILALTLLGLFFALGRWLFDAVDWPQGMWSMSLMVSTYYLIAFFAITRPAVFNPAPAPPGIPAAEPAAAAPAAGPRYATSSLSSELAHTIHQQLEAVMAARQPYLDNQLKIADLAALVELPVNHLSQTINQVGGCSFFEYVNRYRVQAAREMLLDPRRRDLTMLAVAMAVGFNSESVFYKQFKQHTGLTPRQFRQQN